MQLGTDARRGIDLAARAADAHEAAHAEAVVPAEPLEQTRVAAPLVAEGEIVPDHGVADGEAAHQNLAHEGFGAELGKRLVEGEHDELFDPQRLDEAHLDAERREPEGRQLRTEEAARVRLEGKHGKGCGERARDFSGLGDDRLMAAMNAVEIADGDHGTPGSRGQLRVMAKDAHLARGSFPGPKVRSLSLNWLWAQAAAREGTITCASPSSTTSLETVHTVARVTRRFSGATSRMVTRALTVSPERTGALNLRFWER